MLDAIIRTTDGELMSTTDSATLPRGLVARGDQVTLSYGPAMHVMVWFAALLPIALAALMAITVPKDEPDAPIVPIVAAMAGVGAIPLLLWWFRVRGVQYAFDADGITKARWRRATVRWDAITDIQLTRPHGKQIWVLAPGGVFFGTKAKDRLILPGRYMAARNTTVHEYLVRRRATRRAG